MKQIITSIALALAALAAQAQSVFPLAQGACWVNLHVICQVPDGATVDTFDWDFRATNTAYFTKDGVTYTGQMQRDPLTINTAFHQEQPFHVALTPTAVLTGTIVQVRGLGGRGAGAWRVVYDFDTLTVY
jgi:hypothetical protein